MKISDKMAVSIHYTLTNSAGEKLDSSRGEEPMVYLQGYGQIITGLENALRKSSNFVNFRPSSSGLTKPLGL